MKLMFGRLVGRNLELELLITAGLVLVVGLGGLALVSGFALGPMDVVIAGAFVLLFVGLSVALALRGWGEDQVLLPLAALLAGIGMVLARRLEPDLVSNVSSAYAGVALKQVVWVLGGALLLAVVSFVPWRMHWLKHYRYSWLILGLVLVLVTAVFGVERNGARLWLNLGFFQFQPVEVLKILLVVYLATYMDDRRQLITVGGTRTKGQLLFLLPLVLMWGLTIGLIVVQKDLGAALLFFTIFLSMLFVVTSSTAYVLAGIGAFAAGAAVLYPLFAHVRVRVNAWLNPWADPGGGGFQLIQSLYALASGGLFGTGLGQGNPTTVPESHTDFVFAALGEELGLVGAAALLICYGLFALRGYQVALSARNGFEQLLAAGLTTAIVAQALIITAGTTNLVPLTGITMPFVSYGGSATLVNFAMVGILLRISAANKPPQVV